MENAKEFEGKTLDEAIGKACEFYDAPREKLEIDILQDAKSGIFGLVGVRKAVIQARMAPVAARVSDILSSPRAGRSAQAADPGPESPEPARRQTADSGPRQEKRRKTPRQAQDDDNVTARRDVPEGQEPDEAAVRAEVRPEVREDEPRPRRRLPREGRGVQPGRSQEAELDLTEETAAERSAYVPVEDLDPDQLREAVLEISRQLIAPIAGEASLELEIGGGRVAVHIHSDEDLGLLIGREGQTLACLQYLASRMVARRMGSPVRLQFDAGDYRERQDEKLRELAFMLAERAKATGRVCPTRPLSSYQRRIVHMALQDDPAIQTRSTGEGPLKRVVIQRARSDQ